MLSTLYVIFHENYHMCCNVKSFVYTNSCSSSSSFWNLDFKLLPAYFGAAIPILTYSSNGILQWEKAKLVETKKLKNKLKSKCKLFILCIILCTFLCLLCWCCKIYDSNFYILVGYTTSDLVFMWQSDPVQMDEIALPQFDIKQEDIKYGNCTKYYQGTG